MKFFPAVYIWMAIIIVPWASLAEPLPNESPPVELLDHSWRFEEALPKVLRTTYSWRAKVRNNSDVHQKVSVYYHLMDENGFSFARNMMSRIVPPHQTVEITSDSYVGNSIVPVIKNSRAVIKFQPKSK